MLVLDEFNCIYKQTLWADENLETFLLKTGENIKLHIQQRNIIFLT